MEHTPYLIQRAKFSNDSSDREGIDSILDFDYMGAAEFEFGTLPKSLKRVRSAVNDFVQFDYAFTIKSNKVALKTEKIVTVFCHKDHQAELPEILEKLYKCDIRLKFSCDLYKYIEDKELSYRASDFWWDIDNDFFFWRKNDEFAEAFVTKMKTPKA